MVEGIVAGIAAHFGWWLAGAGLLVLAGAAAIVIFGGPDDPDPPLDRDIDSGWMS